MPGSLADHGHRWEHPGFCPRGTKLVNLVANRTSSQGQDWCPLALNCVTRGMWNSFVSKIRGLLGGFGSLLALCSSLKSPVPMFIGIPMMMHSDEPGTNRS